MADSDASVRIHIDNQVAHVRLDRVDRRNAFDDHMVAELRQHFLSLARDADIRAVVLEGEGAHFSAGADLQWMQRMANYDVKDNTADAHVLAGMLHALYELPMPTVAVVRGAAFGGAVGLIACCDIAVAADDAVFALSEVRLGLIPATISPYVIRAIGERASRRLFMTGERFDPETAQRIGLISEFVPGADLDSCRQRILGAILAGGPEAVPASKRLVRDVSGQPIDAALIDDTCQAIAEIRVSSEGQSGLKAFLSKQPAPWVNES